MKEFVFFAILAAALLLAGCPASNSTQPLSAGASVEVERAVLTVDAFGDNCALPAGTTVIILGYGPGTVHVGAADCYPWVLADQVR